MRIRRNKQKGFTLVELITVIALVSLLAVYLSVEMGDSGEDAKVAMSSAFLLANMPQAINAYRARHAGSCAFADGQETVSAVVVTAELSARGLAEKTPWGDSWTAAYDPTARQLTVMFPTTSSESPEAAAKDIGAATHGKPQTVFGFGGKELPPKVGDVVVEELDLTGTGTFGKNYAINCKAGKKVACITYKCN